MLLFMRVSLILVVLSLVGVTAEFGAAEEAMIRAASEAQEVTPQSADNIQEALNGKGVVCDVCKMIVGDAWYRTVKRKKRGDATEAEQLEKYIDSRCTGNGATMQRSCDNHVEPDFC